MGTQQLEQFTLLVNLGVPCGRRAQGDKERSNEFSVY